MSNDILTVVVAANKNWLIGKNGSLPWKLKSDLNMFKSITMYENVVMGKNTYLSLPESGLPGRKIHVMSKTLPKVPEKYQLVKTYKAISMMENPFIVGGVEMYNRYIPQCDVLYITRVECDEYNGKTINPVDFDRFHLIAEYPILNEKYKDVNSHRHVLQHWVSKKHFIRERMDDSIIISPELSIWNEMVDGYI